ncbi:MAG: histidine phosphatase family protein [Brevibacillus sp.]|nr:histidine phosphatase family protein [Brevibacillus sp.]
MTKLIWVRHGVTHANQQKQYIGHLDVPLSEAGREQAERVAAVLRHLPIAAVYSSDLSRSVETAEAICRYHQQLVVRQSSDLRELSFGRWEGKSYSGIAAGGDQEIRRFYDDPWRNGPPDGETVEDLQRRLDRFLQQVRQCHACQDTIVAVTHGGVISLFQALYLKQDRAALFSQPLAHGGMVCCEYDVHQGMWRDGLFT